MLRTRLRLVLALRLDMVLPPGERCTPSIRAWKSIIDPLIDDRLPRTPVVRWCRLDGRPAKWDGTAGDSPYQARVVKEVVPELLSGGEMLHNRVADLLRACHLAPVDPP